MNGKSLQKFDQNRSKVQNTWLFTRTGDAGEEPCFRVVLGEAARILASHTHAPSGRKRRTLYLSLVLTFLVARAFLSCGSLFSAPSNFLVCVCVKEDLFPCREGHPGCVGEWAEDANSGESHTHVNSLDLSPSFLLRIPAPSASSRMRVQRHTPSSPLTYVCAHTHQNTETQSPHSRCFQYEFGDEGTETHFTLPSGTPAFIRATSSGKRRDGVVHSLIIDDTVIPPAKD